MSNHLKIRYHEMWAVLLVIALLCGIFVLAAGCSKNLQESPEHQYLAARTFYNDAYETYLDEFEAADMETRTKYLNEISPIFKQAELVLDLWADANTLDDTAGIVENRQKWRKIKNDLIDAMTELME